jgi:hypothetical protein
MRRMWNPLMKPIIEKINAHYIVEVGSATGGNTWSILEYCRDHDAHMTAIDPFPSFDVEKYKKEFGDKFDMCTELSLDALPQLKDYDVVLLDGDHNWYTVYHELKVMEKTFIGKKFPLVFLHDVGWPYARRDGYYNPKDIPEKFRQPYKQAGMRPGRRTLVDNGGLNSDLYNAVDVNTPRNGVLTAAEDFIKESDSEFYLDVVNPRAFHGLGILYPQSVELKKMVTDVIKGTDFRYSMEKLKSTIKIFIKSYYNPYE